MSEAIPWKLLQDQYFSDSTYEDEIAKLVHSPEEVCSCFSWLLFSLLSFTSCINMFYTAALLYNTLCLKNIPDVFSYNSRKH